MSTSRTKVLSEILIVAMLCTIGSRYHRVQAQSPTFKGEFVVQIDNPPASPQITVIATGRVYGSSAQWYPDVNRWNFYSIAGAYEALGFIDRPGGPQAADTFAYAQYKVTCVSADYYVYIDYRDADLPYPPSMDLTLYFNNATHTWSYTCNGRYYVPMANHASKGIWDLFFSEPGDHPRVPVTVQNYFNGGYGGTVVIDQVLKSSPCHAIWSLGNHIIAAPSPQPGSWWFDHWSDGGAQSHTVTASVGNFGTVYTAYYTHQLLHLQAAGFGMTAYPNPFNPVSTICYELQQTGHVQVTVADNLGREVAILVDGIQTAGTHEAQFNASNLASGVYYCRIRNLSGVRMTRLLLVK